MEKIILVMKIVTLIILNINLGILSKKIDIYLVENNKEVLFLKNMNLTFTKIYFVTTTTLVLVYFLNTGTQLFDTLDNMSNDLWIKTY